MSALNAPYFQDDDKAREYLEAIRWPDGPVCPHCGSVKFYTLNGKAHRPGLYKCADCRGQFSVTVGTVFESSKIGLSKWLQAVYLICSSKKGISSHQIHRTLGITYKSAWFMTHRIREAMRTGELAPMGGDGGPVEVDETFIGREPGAPKKRAYHHKMKVLALVDRKSKQVRSMVVDNIRPETLVPILRDNIAKEAHVMTDDGGQYYHLDKDFAQHDVVGHGEGEYVRGNVHTNTIEGYFGIFKRGMKGTYQHCAKHHLHRYLAEFDFRYNNRVALEINDKERAVIALKGAAGKRLVYRGPCKQFESRALQTRD